MADAVYPTNYTQYEVSRSLYKDFKTDNGIDSWLLVNSWWPIGIILAVYLTFVLKLGPKFMESRKPFNIKYILLFYNLMQAIFNGYIMAYPFITPGTPSYLWNHWCHPDSTGTKSHITDGFHKATWYFAVSKIIDLLDTIFFVLRKKKSQISFLHVYHHVNMVITCFFHTSYVKSENSVIGVIINSFVHIVMYSYYFLSALGPDVQKYLWWKKYLTRIQITQFTIGIAYCLSLFAFNCTYPKLFILYVIADVFLFLYMFLQFYRNTYDKKMKKSN